MLEPCLRSLQMELSSSLILQFSVSVSPFCLQPCLDSVLWFGEKESVSTIERVRKRKYQNLSSLLSCRLLSESEPGAQYGAPGREAGGLCLTKIPSTFSSPRGGQAGGHFSGKGNTLAWRVGKDQEQQLVWHFLDQKGVRRNF